MAKLEEFRVWRVWSEIFYIWSGQKCDRQAAMVASKPVSSMSMVDVKHRVVSSEAEEDEGRRKEKHETTDIKSRDPWQSGNQTD